MQRDRHFALKTTLALFITENQKGYKTGREEAAKMWGNGVAIKRKWAQKERSVILEDERPSKRPENSARFEDVGQCLNFMNLMNLYDSPSNLRS